jgi:hypothetical protein
MKHLNFFLLHERLRQSFPTGRHLSNFSAVNYLCLNRIESKIQINSIYSINGFYKIGLFINQAYTYQEFTMCTKFNYTTALSHLSLGG